MSNENAQHHSLISIVAGTLLSAAAACSTSSAATGPESTQVEADRAEVAALVTRFDDAWNRHDMKALGALFSEDAEFVNVIGMQVHGRPEIESHHAVLHQGRMKQSMLKSAPPKVRFLTPDVAVIHATWRLTGDRGAPGWHDTDNRRGVFIHVAQRAQQGWLIVASQNTEIVDLPNN